MQCLEIIYFKDWFWSMSWCRIASELLFIYLFIFSFWLTSSRSFTTCSLSKMGRRLKGRSIQPQTASSQPQRRWTSCQSVVFWGLQKRSIGPKHQLCFPRLLLVAVKEVIDGLCTAPPWLHQSGVITPVCGIQIKSVHSGSFAAPVEKSLKNKQV